jgi:hypothetical protein
MSVSYTNYRWVPSNARKGDRWQYKRDRVVRFYRSNDVRYEEQVIATVTYDSDSKSPHWGKWHINIGAHSPELHALRKSDIPKFSSKDDAMAWTAAMIRLTI